jgi:hypothetical protein
MKADSIRWTTTPEVPVLTLAVKPTGRELDDGWKILGHVRTPSAHAPTEGSMTGHVTTRKKGLPDAYVFVAQREPEASPETAEGSEDGHTDRVA